MTESETSESIGIHGRSAIRYEQCIDSSIVFSWEHLLRLPRLR